MAYIRKATNGWQAQIELKGVRKSITLPRKADVVAWAAAEETAIRACAMGKFPSRTLAEAFREYELKVSKKNRGSRAESLRFAKFERLFPELATKVLHKIDEVDIANWRNARLEKVKPNTVLREAAQLRSVFTVAAKEWKWCALPTPFASVRLPAKPRGRRERWSWSQVRMMLRHMRYRRGVAPHMVMQQVAYAFLLAEHTAMRASEVLGLARSNNDLERRVYTLVHHKTMDAEGPRYVPYTRRAARIMHVLAEAAKAAGRDRYFTISAGSLDANFRKAKKQLLLDGLHFHDSRADALTRMARKVDVMTLARISGHRDLQQLLETYYRETAAEIAKRL